MKYAYRNATILTGEKDMEPLQGMTLLTSGDRIEAIVPDTGDVPGYETVDLQGKYLMPGLINLHVHLPGSGKPSGTGDTKKLVKLLTSNALFRKIVQLMCEGYAKTELMSGVTTLRTVGGVQEFDGLVRDRIARGEIPGPRILAANMAVSVPGGHMAGSLAYEATSAEEAAAYTRRIADGGADLIKLMITGGVLDATVKGEPGELKMPADYVKAACDAAHERGLSVAAHVESPEGVRVALENGVDTIEHGAKPDGEILSLFRDRGAALVATLSPALPYALFDRAVSGVSEMEQYNGEVVFRGIVDCAKACVEAGIPVGLGTDTGCPYITHYDMWREVNYFRKFCGVDGRFALYTATLGNAQIAGIDGETGSLAAGKCADMLVLRRNPMEELGTLRNPAMVIRAGTIYKNPKVKKMDKVEKELDKFL
ncbi:MAG: amidohydrolase family protein [Oscillospiraceae bacterium]|nr:amidohydrolase family protein [Oscillospiraceae bacterium]